MSTSNEKIRYKKCLFKETKEHVVDIQLTLPDYYPDICRVLTCQVYPYIESIRSDSERISVDGIALVRLLYCDDEKRMHLFESELRYSKTAQPDKIADEHIIECDQKIVNVGYRAIGPRRVDVKANVALTVESSELSELAMVSDYEDDIEALVKEYELFDISACCCDSFVIEESYTIRDDRIPDSRILHDSAKVYVTEIKTVKDKILIKGHAELDILYFDQNEQIVFRYNESVPFSQVMDIYGLSDDDKCNVVLQTQRLSLSLKENGECVMKLMVLASVSTGKLKNIAITQDLYSTKFNLTPYYETAHPCIEQRAIADSFLCTGQSEKTDAEDVQILAVYQGDITQNFTLFEGKININGQLSVVVLLRSAGELKTITRSLPFDYSKDADIKADGQIKCILTCKNVVCNKTNQEMIVKAEMEVSGYYVQQQSLKYIADFECCKEEKELSDDSLITLYFAEVGESVWDVAKRNKVSLQLLKEVNDLQENIIEDDKVLVLFR